MKKTPSQLKASPPEEGRKQLPGYARYSNMAFQMFAIIGVGVFGGVKLDEWLNLKFPVFTLILSIISVAAAIYSAIKDLIRK